MPSDRGFDFIVEHFVLAIQGSEWQGFTFFIFKEKLDGDDRTQEKNKIQKKKGVRPLLVGIWRK